MYFRRTRSSELLAPRRRASSSWPGSGSISAGSRRQRHLGDVGTQRQRTQVRNEGGHGALRRHARVGHRYAHGEHPHARRIRKPTLINAFSPFSFYVRQFISVATFRASTTLAIRIQWVVTAKTQSVSCCRNTSTHDQDHADRNRNWWDRKENRQCDCYAA